MAGDRIDHERTGTTRENKHLSAPNAREKLCDVVCSLHALALCESRFNQFSFRTIAKNRNQSDPNYQ